LKETNKAERKEQYSVSLSSWVKELVPRNKGEPFSAALERFILENTKKKAKK